MTVIGEAFIEVKPKTEGFEKETTSRVSSIAKKAAATFAGVFAVREGVQFAKGLVADAEEVRRVNAQTAQAIKSTGGAAQVSAKDITSLADSISMVAGVDDEAIQSSENLLLTFTNVQNRVGAGNDVFKQATQAIVDMSAVQGDLQGNTLLVGKALQDPVAGMTALQRVGVRLTEAQKDQIKQFVAVGDVASAQKVILKELGTEFGGQAAAQATAGKKLGVVWGNIKEDLGARLLPIIDKVATVLAENLPGAMDKAGEVFRAVADPIGAAVGVLRGFLEAIEPVTNFVRENSRWFVALGVAIASGVVAFVAVGKAMEAWHAITGALTKAQAAFNLVLAMNPILLIVAAVAALVGALVYAYFHFEGFRKAVDAVVDTLMSALAPAFDFVRNLVTAFAAWWSEVWPQISEAVTHVFNVASAVVTAALEVIVAVAQTVVDAILKAWSLFGDSILTVVSAVWDQVRAVIELAINTVKNTIEFVLAIINGDWGAAWDALKGIVSGVWDFIVATIGNAGQIIVGLLSGLWVWVKTAAGEAWDGFKTLAGNAVQGVIDLVTGLPGQLLGLVGKIKDAALAVGKAILSGIGDGIGAAVGFVSDLASTILSALKRMVNTQIIDRINDALEFDIGFFGRNIHIDPPDIPHLAGGALLRATPGGVPFLGAEAGRDEAVLPLPPGLLEGLRRIAASPLAAPAPVSVTGPLATFELTFGPGSNADDIEQAMRVIVRDELQPVLATVVRRVAAGAGSR